MIVLVKDLAPLRATALSRIDAAAEAALADHVGGGRIAAVHAAKLAEATRAVQAWAPAPEDYPLLAAEAGITAPDIAAVAALVIARDGEARAALARIEPLRLAAKAAVRAATTPAAIEAATLIDWSAS